MKQYCSDKGIELLFTARYSSPLNAIEHVWAAVKLRWRKFLSAKDSKYNHKLIKNDLLNIIQDVKVTPKLE